MVKKTTLTVLIIVFFLGFSYNLKAQSTHHDHEHTHSYTDMADNHAHGPMQSNQIARKAKLVTGQGDFVFSWDQELTAAFPKDAVDF